MKLLKNVVRVAAVSLIALGLSGSLALADSSGDIDDTGPFSENSVDVHSSSWTSVANRNKVDVDNTTRQSARSGNALVWGNFFGGGSATSGAAVNESTTVTEVGIENDTDTGNDAQNQEGSVSDTGPFSKNYVNLGSSDRTKVTNYNKVDVDNYTKQSARSGNATVKGNFSGGSATSGDAINDSWTETAVGISNTTGTGSSGGDQDGAVSDTGPFSKNQVNIHSDTKTKVSNYNRADIDNYTKQSATSGNATVRNNFMGGSATSGDAMNFSTTGTMVGISNTTN